MGSREVKNPDFREYTVIIDAIFGIGVSRPLAGEYRRAVEAICASGVPVLAVDIPSGIHTDTGEVLDAAVKARATVTFACAKPGLLLIPENDMPERSWSVISESALMQERGDALVRFSGKRRSGRFLTRTPMGNKGTFGKVLVLAGSGASASRCFVCQGSPCIRCRHGKGCDRGKKPYADFLCPAGSNGGFLEGG